MRLTRRAMTGGLIGATAFRGWPSFAAGDGIERFALLIGNEKYEAAVGPLKNPLNDVRLVREALLSVGFSDDRIVVAPNLKRAEMLAAVRAHAQRVFAAGEAGFGFFYYCGHGAANKEEGGKNFLIPVDVSDARSDALWDDAVELEKIFAVLTKETKAAQVIALDSCRSQLNLPNKALGDRGMTRTGGAPPRNSYISYACWEGTTASDGLDGAKNGPYALALADQLHRKDGLVDNVFFQVQWQVDAATKGKQFPQNIPLLNPKSHATRYFKEWNGATLPKERQVASHALVIANATYANAQNLNLPSAREDAETVARALQDSGYETTRAFDVKRSDFKAALANFAAKLDRAKDDAVGVLYFDGYGAGSNGHNFLIPADMAPEDMEQISRDGISVGDIISVLRSRGRASLFLLDGGRRIGNLVDAKRGEQFLVPVERDPSNFILSFTCQPGTFVKNQRGPSAFARAFAKEIGRSKRRSVQTILTAVSKTVEQEAGGQKPWFQDATGVPIYFQNAFLSLP